MSEMKTLENRETIQEENEDTQKDKYLTFHLGGEDYAISIKHVTEIVGVQKITAVPEMSSDIKGVINLRGKIIPLMDIRLRFHLAARDYDDRTCVIVVNMGDASVGLVVDTVSEVLDMPESQIEPVSSVNRTRANHFIHGIGKSGEDIKIVLNVDKLLYDRVDLDRTREWAQNANVN